MYKDTGLTSLISWTGKFLLIISITALISSCAFKPGMIKKKERLSDDAIMEILKPASPLDTKARMVIELEQGRNIIETKIVYYYVPDLGGSISAYDLFGRTVLNMYHNDTFFKLEVPSEKIKRTGRIEDLPNIHGLSNALLEHLPYMLNGKLNERYFKSDPEIKSSADSLNIRSSSHGNIFEAEIDVFHGRIKSEYIVSYGEELYIHYKYDDSSSLTNIKVYSGNINLFISNMNIIGKFNIPQNIATELSSLTSSPLY